MVHTFVIRLVSDALTRGRFVGRVEHVATGQTATVHTPAELAAFALRIEAQEPEPEEDA